MEKNGKWKNGMEWKMERTGLETELNNVNVCSSHSTHLVI